MSFAQEVLQTLQAADGPMRNVDIREELGLEAGAASTTKISTALSDLITRGAVERVLEGSIYAYIAVPGYKPAERGGGVPARDADDAQGAAEASPQPETPPTPPDAAQRLVQAVAGGAQVVAGHVTQARVDAAKGLIQPPPKRRGPPPGKRKPVAAVPESAGVAMAEAILEKLESPSTGEDPVIPISRRTVRLLVAGVMVFADELGPELREAVRGAIKATT